MPTTKVKGSAEFADVPKNAKSMFAPMCHICTHVPGFQNATEATQFSISRHLQLFLAAPFVSTHNRLPALSHEVICTAI